MAYFANGSEEEVYTARYCDRCQHNEDGDGCVIMDLHMLWNYEQTEDNDKRIALETLIPTGENGFPLQCLMFIAN